MTPTAVPAGRFLVDENLPRQLAEALQADGYEALHAVEAGLRGRPDEEVFRYAQAHNYAVVTCDIGLSNPVVHVPPHAGVVVVRVPQSLGINARVRIVVEAPRTIPPGPLDNRVVRVEIGRVRVHRVADRGEFEP